MSWQIPLGTDYSLKRGEKGIVVWSLQRALNDLQRDIALDGDFGAGTEASVKLFQKAAGLAEDGIAGPATQKALCEAVLKVAAPARPVPVGLLNGFAAGEGGWLLGAVNHAVPGGVDCGVFQRRVYEGDYGNDAAIQRAFDVRYQARLVASSLGELRDIFAARAGTNDGYAGLSANEKAWRLAALNHNYPSGADRLSRTPTHQLPAYWLARQSWVANFGYRFPDGTAIVTPLQWCHLYAGVLGRSVHGTSGLVTKYVTDWTP